MVKVDSAKCDGCGTCAEGCPNSSMKVENGKAHASEECIDCGACIDSCPNQAIIAG